jgi:prenyltransferase beta subunit
VSYTAFGVMALRAAGESAGRSTVQWLVNSQNSDGGFGVARSSASDADMTGAALQALATVGRRESPTARRAAAWLRDNQNGDGGYGQFKGRSSNVQSTSYAVQGLLAVGEGGGAVSRAQSYLVRRQRGDGSIAYSSSSAQTPVWVTAQALMALEGKPLPLATVPRRKRSRAGASDAKGDGGGAKAGGGKSKAGGAKGGGEAAAGAGTAAGEPGVGAAGGAAATGDPAAEPEGTTAATLAQEAASSSATGKPEPVPVWAGILAAAILLGLLWALHRYVLPRRADVG